MTYLGYPPLTRPLLDPLWEKQESPPTTLRYGFRFVLPPRRRPRDLFARLICRPSSAHVSGGLRGPFWEPFWPQKCLFFVALFLVPWVLCLSLFSIDFCYACPLKFACFGRCEKKAHLACDPQKPMEFHVFCICAVPPATQQGRQQRTTYSIEIGPKKHSNI